MPYIKQADRTEASIAPNTAGELNYAITMLVVEYVAARIRARGLPEANYNLHNEIMGVFASAQAEYYRRCVAPYEDRKRVENGDVYYASE